jgi:hypothetical protein
VLFTATVVEAIVVKFFDVVAPILLVPLAVVIA